MPRKKETCEVCNKSATSLTKCKSCGHNYCSKCHSSSTSQNFCKECVAMEGIISKE